MTEDWEAISNTAETDQKQTGEQIEHLTEIGKAISTLPTNEGKFHPGIVKIF